MLTTVQNVSTSNNEVVTIYYFYMGFLIKAFAIFWAVWFIWYITGGPLRDDRTKPYVGFTASGTIETMGTSSVKQ